MDNLEHPDLVSQLESEDPIGPYSISHDLSSDPRAILDNNSYLFPGHSEPLHCKTEDHDDDEDNNSIPEHSAPSSPNTFSPVTQTLQSDTNTTLSLIHRSASLHIDDRTLDQTLEGHSSWGLFEQTLSPSDGDNNLVLPMCNVGKSTGDGDASMNLALLDDNNGCPSSTFESPSQPSLPSDFTFTKFGQNLQGDAASSGVDNMR
jgi:hypothetical protein